MAWSLPPKTVTLDIEMPEPRPFELDPAKTALVLVDMQERSVRVRDAGVSTRRVDIIDGTVRLLGKARGAGALVIHIQSVRLPDNLEVTRFGCEAILAVGSPEADILPEVAPVEGESVVLKRGHDPFARTGLDAELERLGIVPEDWNVLVAGVGAATCAHACTLGFSNRHFLTLVPMDCTAATTLEDEARIYAQYRSRGYRHNVGFTTSELVTFRPGAAPGERQLPPTGDLGW